MTVYILSHNYGYLLCKYYSFILDKVIRKHMIFPLLLGIIFIKIKM